jgi:site-specific recombinase XerD
VVVKRLPDLLVVQIRKFTSSLVEQGYADQTLRSKLQLVTNFGQWLKRNRLAVTKLDGHMVEAFFKRKRRVRSGSLRTLQQFLDHLRKHDVVPARVLYRDRSPLGDILNRYETYLRTERGLVAETILGYQDFVRKFLICCFRERPFCLKAVKASDISDFILRHSPNMALRRAQLMTTAFRSFFRFLFQKGELQADLAASVPRVADWRLSTVPKFLTPKEVKGVLKACNRGTAVGRRDYTILLLLARLGLRAGEVVALQLEDIDWRAGEILIRGKGLLHDRMPLPADVGEALASFLPNTPRVRLHQSSTPGFCWSLHPDNYRSPCPRASGLTPRIQRSPSASAQLSNFHVACWGDDGGNRRDPSSQGA